ncbi:MAG: transporter [Clostridium sp.]
MIDVFKICAVFIGTIIGAGLASGQEILQFFAVYGYKSFIGIGICCGLYVFFSIVIVSLCYKHKFKSYNDMALYVLGDKFGRVTDLFLTFFIFTGNTIMISGGGAMLNEFFGLNKAIGIILMALLSFLVTSLSTKGLIATNLIVVPLSTLMIVLIGIFTYMYNPDSISNIINVNPIQGKSGFLSSSVLYASFNLILATGVICPLALEIKSKRKFITGCIIGGVILTILAVCINFALLAYYPSSFNSEIPTLYISKKFSGVFMLMLTGIIWLEMFSTEISNLYSLGKRMEHSFKISYTTSVLIIILLSIPVAFVGFSNLIRILYPPFGAISLIFLIGCLTKIFKKDKLKMIIGDKKASNH